MISGELRHMHGLSNIVAWLLLHFIQVTAPDNEVPVFGPGMHPRSLVHVTELEGVFDGKTQFRTERAVGDRYYSCCLHHDDQ